MRTVSTDVLVIGSGAGGATIACRLAEAGRSVTVVEEGPWVDPDAHEPFSLGEMAAQFRHRGGAAALGTPPIAYAEGRCVGGSTEVNSGLWHRLPPTLTEDWRTLYRIDEFTPEALDRYAEGVEADVGVATVPGAPPRSSGLIEEGAAKVGWRSTEFPRAFRYDERGRGTKQTMARTLLPRAVAAGAEILPDTRVQRLVGSAPRVTGARARQTRPDGTVEDLLIRAEEVFVCGGAIQTPTLLQRSGVRRRIGRGLKLHPTIKVAARFPFTVDHGDVPMHRITDFSPHLTIGGSASRRGHVAMALAESGEPVAEAMEDWESISVYYAAIRSEGSGLVLALPGLTAPLVTYRLTPGDMSRLTRGLLHLGELLLAAGATELYPSVVGGGVAREPADLARWWDAVTPATANLMTIHMTSSVRMGEDRTRTGTDSFGRVHGFTNLHVADASLLPDAPGVNPQAGIMAIAARNAAHFLSR
ncbi:GMC family oxidoreductase [Iamia sp. SCSIO 61187]|uniref:FAD-dependent oxidoreductase n=1 Tax=Iamia sp. SCSIO 61187 TaxID=2722752 RepID=UPI001C62C05F|nr:GMC family oxidoreductase [Iamia sp. SCSIO 61187]QYG93013.1 GMC family oxidoreductase [Iamia sp. SCSIO 61187]